MMESDSAPSYLHKPALKSSMNIDRVMILVIEEDSQHYAPKPPVSKNPSNNMVRFLDPDQTMKTLKKGDVDSENVEPINVTEYLEQNGTMDSI